MGLVDAKRVVTSAVEQYREKMVSPYTRFLRGAPTFSTYFSQSKVESTVSMGTQQINALIGENSPVTYNKIIDMVMYQFKQLNPNIDYSETGYQADITSDCIILPETIVPVPNDLFIVSYLGKDYLFKVTKVNINIIESNNFYSIEYELYKTNWKLSDINVTETFKFMYDNIGTDAKTILHCDTYDDVKAIEALTVNLKECYVELFYRRYLNSFVCNTEDGIVYNKYLTSFIESHSLMTTNVFPIKLTMEVDMGRNFNKLYNKSIYGVLEDDDLGLLINNQCINTCINKPHSVMNMYKGNYISLEVAEFKCPDDFKFLGFITEELFIAVKHDGVVDFDINSLSNEMDKILYKYLKSSKMLSKEDIDTISNYIIGDTLEDFHNIPLIIYILNKNIDLKTNYISDTKDNLNRGGLGSI